MPPSRKVFFNLELFSMLGYKMSKTRLWCFTNFDLEFDYQKVIDTTTAQYILIGTELCPKTKKKTSSRFLLFFGCERFI